MLLGLVDRVARRMRAAHRIGRTVTLRLRFDDFSRATRSLTLNEVTAETQAIFDTARALLAVEARLIERRGLTLVGVAVSNLADDTPVQLPLPSATVPFRFWLSRLDHIRTLDLKPMSATRP